MPPPNDPDPLASPPIRQPPRSPHGEIGFRLWKVTNGLMRAIDAALRPHGLTHAQCVVMLGVSYLGPDGAGTRDGASARISDVAALDGLDLNHASQVLSRLEAHDLVRRTPDPDDARARRVALTPKGRSLLDSALPAMDDAQDRFVGALSADERHTLLGLLRTMETSRDGIRHK